jgi:acetoin:2,6-dichlorophenolindophenol oxidoreductase subunit alpha
VDDALADDPIARAREAYLRIAGTTAAPLDAIDRAAHDEIEAAVAAANAAPWPEAAAAFTDVQDTGAGQWR